MLSFTASAASDTRMSSQCLTLGSSKLCLQMGFINIRFLVSFHVVPIWNPEKLTLCFNIRLITSILTNLVFNQNSWTPVSEHWDDTLLVKGVLKPQCLRIKHLLSVAQTTYKLRCSYIEVSRLQVLFGGPVNA
ncbi:MAG: hypothetical protein PG978_000232 [Wolbachia endosymbiont of Ctenocephalides felis wCfeF]|nr:MAG: hypothetical protein PG978_000232 [Wolbachia endosymbiont of Ctenocephalides felis wCfeF]